MAVSQYHHRIAAQLNGADRAHYLEIVSKADRKKEEALLNKDWGTVLMMESSFDRLPKMVEIWPNIPPDKKRDTLFHWWDNCDGNIFDYRQEVVEMFRGVGFVGDLHRPLDPIRLYRGTTNPRWARGVSWTTTLRVARFFADGGRFGPQGGSVYTAEVPPEAILGRFIERSESEYVVDFNLLPRLRRLEVIPPGQYVELYKLNGSD